MTYNARIKNARNGIINVTGSILAVTGTILSTVDITASANLSASSIFTTNLTASTVSASVYLGLPPAVAGAGGPDTSVQFNSGSQLTGSSQLTYNNSTNTLSGSSAKFIELSGTTISGSVITASHVNIDYIDFFTGSAANPDFQTGRVFFDINSKDLQFNTEIPTVSFNLGQQLAVKVKNNLGYTINKGSLVRITSGIGSLPIINTASYEDDNNSANTLGMLMQTVAANDTSFVLLVGVIEGLNLNPATYTAGDLLYLSSSGNYTNVKPVAPLHSVRIGEVIRAHATQGAAFIKIDNGYEIGELHDVASISASAGDLLVYNSGSQIWENKKSLTGSYAVTGNLNITSTVSASNATFTNMTASTALFQNNITVQGTASIAQLNTVNQTSLVVGDKYITILSGGIDHTGIDGAGFLWGTSSGPGETTGSLGEHAHILYDASRDALEIFPGLFVTGTTTLQNTIVTGNLTATSTISGNIGQFTSITGTLNGTASYATNAGNASTVTNGVYTNTSNTFTDINTFNTSYITASVGITGSDAKFTTITGSTTTGSTALFNTISASTISASNYIGISTGSSLSTYSSSIGDNSATSFALTHSLNKTNIMVTVREFSTGSFVYPDITYNSSNVVTVSFVSAPTTNQYLVSILGF